LREAARFKRKPFRAYGDEDTILWFSRIPKDLEISSVFHSENLSESPDQWLRVRKESGPVPPPCPEVIQEWIRPQDQNLNPDNQPELLSEITVIVEGVPKIQDLKDHPEVEEAWLDYIVNQWEPWSKKMRHWQAVYDVYEKVDFMRRRLEEAEERYELVLAVGLLLWRDPTGSKIKRHLLTAPAEITLDAARGLLRVTPAASFERFRVELDMLELQNQPRFDKRDLDERLETLDVQAWDRAKVGEILRHIANHASSRAQVDENVMEPPERADEVFRVTYAPALVLRKRRQDAYEELVERFLDDYESGACPSTLPWERLILEGETSQNCVEEAVDGHPVCGSSRIYFPLPKNEEQEKIIHRLRASPCVLVKGPPGTGKSHTIANLICHLLATGERVLVTAHASKALTVLREKLPSDIRALCVTALGSTREDQKLLEDSVRGILCRRDNWQGSVRAQEEIERLEQELSQLEGECAKVERQLREYRESERYRHTIAGYEGTAAQIARKVEEDDKVHGWFPELIDANSSCPLEQAELEFLAKVHGSWTADQLQELNLEIPDWPVPDLQTFQEAVRKLKHAEGQKAAFLCDGISHEEQKTLYSFADADLEACKVFLSELENCTVRSKCVLGELASEVLKDLVVGRIDRWNSLVQDLEKGLEPIEAANQRLGMARVEFTGNYDRASLLADARRRLTHFQNGGRRGWMLLAPRVVRETRYVEDSSRINGQSPVGPELLNTLVTFLELDVGVAHFFEIWPTTYVHDHSDPRRSARDAVHLTRELKHIVELFKSPQSRVLNLIPAALRPTLAEEAEQQKWKRLAEAETARRLADRATEPFDTWLRAIRDHSTGSTHPCMAQLVQAIEQRDIEKWRTALASYEQLRTSKCILNRYRELVNRLYKACPELGKLVDSNWQNPQWKQNLANLDRAWAWAAAKAWLRRISDSNGYSDLVRKHHHLEAEIEKKTEQLAALKAWQAFFNRLDEKTNQSLKAWTRAIERIGKGTGKYAYRHQRTARKYLMDCIPQIPAWIMPLYKLWQTTGHIPGAFDTVIVDEASQAGIESLLLLLLAKRIIVVGDDKQNSPEAVGVPEDDIARLGQKYLEGFRFCEEFRPDTSLFDHAHRAFGSPISLREHFRCVPEIIRFSNDLCYRDAPLIPLRQPPPVRIPPLRLTFVETGSCQGERQYITNRAEADAIVEAIQQCLKKRDYDGKTMGVIVLQGHAQAEYIDKRLAEQLEPREREERRLRCGAPASFQGDERDVIFLSLVVAPNHPSRALTSLDEERRFNVAMSRARDQVWLFHSVQSTDLSREDLRWKLLNFFASAGRGVSDETYQELERLEREASRYPRRLDDQPEPYESWFEVDVALELLRRKYRVRPQYDVAGYRIDIVVEGLETRLAVECDGEAWHGPDRWEQDMRRQRQLERAGWPFVRIRESEFYGNRNRAVQQVLEACKELGIWPADADQDTASRVTEEEICDAPNDCDELNISEGKEIGIQSETAFESRLFSEYPKEDSFPDPRSGSPTSVRTALLKIIEEHGPLPRECVYRLYVDRCPGVQRAGKAVRQALNRALGILLRTGAIIQEDELGDGSYDGLVIRCAGTPKVRERRAGQRDLLDIPPSELFLVLSRVCPPGIAPDDQSLARLVLEYYGFSRLTERRRRYLGKVLQVWRRTS